MLRRINKIYALSAHLFFFLLGSNRGQKPEEDDWGGGIEEAKAKTEAHRFGKGGGRDLVSSWE